MKKQYLFSLVLLLSSHAQYTCAMQEQLNVPAQQAANREQCTLCHQNMPYRSLSNPRVRLTCGHRFHHRCIVYWACGHRSINPYCPSCYRFIQFVPDYQDPIIPPVQPVQPAPIAQVPNQAQSTSAVQPAEQVEQEQCAICYEDMNYGNAQDPRERLACGHKFHRRCLTSWHNTSHNPTCPMCRGPLQSIQDYLDPVAQPVRAAEQAQATNQAQTIPAEQSVAHVEQGQGQQLPDRQLQILQALIRNLAHLDRDDIQVMLIDAYNNPLVLANSDFMAVLTNEQRALAQEFIDLALDAQAAQQEQHGLTQIEHELITQLAQELAPLERDDIDDILIQAYTNPYILVRPELVQVLSEQQKEFVDTLLEIYTQRISQHAL